MIRGVGVGTGTGTYAQRTQTQTRGYSRTRTRGPGAWGGGGPNLGQGQGHSNISTGLLSGVCFDTSIRYVSQIMDERMDWVEIICCLSRAMAVVFSSVMLVPNSISSGALRSQS